MVRALGCKIVVSEFKLQLHNYIHFRTYILGKGGGPCGVMVKAMDCGIVASEFLLQLHYYIHFRANTLGKGMNPLNPVMG